MAGEKKKTISEPPRLLFADEAGRIYDHPKLLALGQSGRRWMVPEAVHWIPLPRMSRLFFIPRCPPRGLDPRTGRAVVLESERVGRKRVRCTAVAAFLEPGYVRTLLPAAETSGKDYVLPLWAYTAVGFSGGEYWVAAIRVEENPQWDPRNFDDRTLMPLLEDRMKGGGSNPLLRHLSRCATQNHCFAAKNLFLGRWEIPLPVSRQCNARCLGCLSRQPKGSCLAAHRRIGFRPEVSHITEIAIPHLEGAESPMVSFGQGCEGEPLTEAPLIAASVKEIRKRTARGSVNLNTNGSLPQGLRSIVDAGLDSVRVSLNSARPRLFEAYVRPRGFTLRDVEESLAMCRREERFTMINYLVFPGITDQEEEWEDLSGLIRRTGVNFLHFKNLCIDPDVYLSGMDAGESPAMGIGEMVHRIREEFPSVRIGYFNQPVRGG